MNNLDYAAQYHLFHDAVKSSLNGAMIAHDIETVYMDTEQSIVNHICRAKDIDTGKWVYGYYLAIQEEYTHGQEITHAIFTSRCEHICMGEYKDYGWYEVDPKTVCRCTCLRDINDQYIFEHDIVARNGKELGEIKFDVFRRYCGWFVHNSYSFDPLYKSLEIVGNIFDKEQ